MATKNESAEIGTVKPKCGKLIYPPGGYLYGSPCGKTATYEHEGAYYCKTHHPPTVEAKHAARDAERRARFDRECVANEASHDELAEMRKNAARYLWLRAAHVGEGSTYPSAPWCVRIELDPWPTSKPCFGASLDAAIDAEMGKQNKEPTNV